MADIADGGSGRPDNAGLSDGAPLAAVVVGGGVAGLLAAHAACRFFDRVTLIEGDHLEESDGKAGSQAVLENMKVRKGIPQYAMPHTLVTGGLQAMEALLPGFEQELIARGGVPLDIMRDFEFFDMGGLNARLPSSALKSVGASRHLIQTALQEAVLQRNAGRLCLRQGCRASGLLWSEDKSAVLGLELHTGEKVPADVVIIANGRYTCLPQWLAAAGHATPPVQKVDAHLTYSSRMYRIPPDWEGSWKGHVTLGRPYGLFGAVVLPVEDNTWQVAAWGINGVVPPTDEEGFLEFIKAMPHQEIYQAIRRAEPLTPLMKYAGTQNFARAWDKVPMPPGLMVIGDAVQALNPVYGQGMCCASQSALALEAAFSDSLSAAGKGAKARRAAVRSMGPAFQKRLAGVIAPARKMASAEDLRYPSTNAEGVSPRSKILRAYVDSVFIAGHTDGEVLNIIKSVSHMIRPAHHVFHPRLLLAALLVAIKYWLACLAGLVGLGSGGGVRKGGKPAQFSAPAPRFAAREE